MHVKRQWLRSIVDKHFKAKADSSPRPMLNILKLRLPLGFEA